LITPAVAEAVQHLTLSLPDHRVDEEPDGQGGAMVLVHDVVIGDTFVPRTSWIGFAIGYQYPDTDVYPHFIDGAVVRADGAALGEGFSATTWGERSALQISRRSNRWDSSSDTATSKLFKVIDWLRSR